MENGERTEQAIVDAGAAEPTRKQSKRVITTARKEQNRLAQRAFRIRQKERRVAHKKPAISRPRRLEPRPDNAVNCITISSPDTGNDAQTNRSHLLAGSVHSPLADANASMPSHVDARGLLARRHQLPSDQLSPSVMQNELDPASSALLLPRTPSDEIDLRPPGLVSMIAGPRSSLEDNSTTIFRACLSNALCIGIDIAELLYCERPCMSPFYRPKTQMSDDPTTLIAASSYDSLPTPLKPTLAQILIPHHASLDLIPLPRLRERAIMMCAALPHIFSLWEMKLDIYTRNALVYQGRGISGESVSQSWDMRGWQAAPWFLSKWKMIVDADEVRPTFSLPGIPGLWT
ncbi:hypothetical protein F4777DRAFT_484455 [Nemania sp. FL0916]|nr:hypothetical protein F4777DRAFT_484455 [Nemania sp. FL0916]